jgi:hypothetical protein
MLIDFTRAYTCGTEDRRGLTVSKFVYLALDFSLGSQQSLDWRIPALDLEALRDISSFHLLFRY